MSYVEKEGKRVWKFGKWAQLETPLPEQVHLWQQNFGENPVKPGRSTHNKEFVTKCESLGLHPLPDRGRHMMVVDGVFAQLWKESGIPRPIGVPREDLKVDRFKPNKEKG